MPLSRAEAVAIIDKARTPAEKNGQAMGAVAQAGRVSVYQIPGLEATEKIGDSIQRLNILIRRPIMNRVAGKLREPVERAIQNAKGHPYQLGPYRLPFRVRNDPTLEKMFVGRLVSNIARTIDYFNQPLDWWALWIGYVESEMWHDTELDLLMANEIDRGDAAMLDTLIRSVEMTHETAVTSRTAIRALLRCKNPRAWSTIEKLLLEAKRGEGLRQAIVECADELSPDNFQRILRLIVEHGLLRFSSVIRAFMMWFPNLMEENQPKSAEKIVLRLLEFLQSPGLEAEPDYGDTYLRLWADAFSDVEVAIRRGSGLFVSDNVDVRRAVAKVVCAASVPASQPLMLRALRDPDLSVAQHGVEYARARRFDGDADLHAATLEAAQRWPKKAPEELAFGRKDVWMAAIQIADTSDLPVYCEALDELPSEGRELVAKNLHELKDRQLQHQTLLRLAGDTMADTRDIAFKSLAKTKLSEPDMLYFEGLLTRTTQSLRTGVINLLVAQPDAVALASARRLAESKHRQQNEAGGDIAKALLQRGVKEAASLVKEVAPTTPQWQLADVFGLLDVSKVTFCELPKAPAWSPSLERIYAMLVDLDSMIHEHRNQPVFEYNYYGNATTKPFGNLSYFSLPTNYFLEHERRAEHQASFDEFAEQMRAWFSELRKKHELTDADLIECHKIGVTEQWSGHHTIEPKKASKWPDIQYTHLIGELLSFAIVDSAQPRNLVNGIISWCQIIQNGDYAIVTSDYQSHVTESSWRNNHLLRRLRRLLLSQMLVRNSDWQDEDWNLAFQAYRFMDEPLGANSRAAAEKIEAEVSALSSEGSRFSSNYKGSTRKIEVPPRSALPIPLIDRAHALGYATDDDYIDQIRCNLTDATKHIRALTGAGQTFVRKVVDRIVEVECERGSIQGPATVMSLNISGAVGLASVLRMLPVVGGLARSSNWVGASSISREQSLTRLLSHSRPFPEETTELCAEEFRQLKVKPVRFVELAVLSPYWARSIELAFGWTGFEDAVWWLHAHTKADDYSRHDNVADAYEGAVSERTSLTLGQMQIGHCDTAWFHRFHALIDPAQWTLLLKSAKFVSGGTGHTRAQLFARALAGEVPAEEVLEKMRAKRNPDYVRAYGLIPLGSELSDEVVARYHHLQDFRLGANQFGSAKQLTDRLAVEVAIDNLAATAGYPDALRLTWSLEAAEVADLRDGGQTVTDGDLTVRLYFDILGQPEIEVKRAAKALKEIPGAAKKVPAVAALTERRKHLRKQASRMRAALEIAMQRRDTFSGSELQGLLDHPGLSPMLRNLVFVAESGQVEFADGLELASPTLGLLRIAHPHDLLTMEMWPDFQRRVFAEERVQPFKQVFRELYVVTPAERENTMVTRFGGHQVRPKQALAILGKRGWIARHEEGVSKTDHRLGITAWISLDYVGYSPADIEGASLEGVEFAHTRTGKRIPPGEVPELLFSETMRDVDLIVSVASMVGHDPEASESTIEMRRGLVEQTCSLLRLTNVSFTDRHAVIVGKLAEYTVHLGGATVHQRAKGELVIIAVRQPQRGRLFLPFVDDDPRSAELVSKVILLARDHEIKDPSILNQIVSR